MIVAHNFLDSKALGLYIFRYPNAHAQHAPKSLSPHHRKSSNVFMNLTRFYQKAGYVFFFNAFAVGCGLIKNIILARHLAGAELGLYSLLFTLVGFIYPLSLLGQQ